MMYIAIDYGKRNIGIALSDKNGLIAKSFSIVKNNDKFFDYLLSLLQKYSILKIVVGIPLDIDGNDTVMSKEIKQKFAYLEKDFD
ncbi:Holliday junction resolvase RuvX, partial [Patescibacteria group bacterium]|nr:Holliday junction resolvase RuvX [Patescibacteria group bacterium]